MNPTVLLAVVAAALIQNAVCKEIPPELKKIIDKCKGEHEVSTEELMAMKSLTVPESEEGKCFLGCVLEESGMLVNGKFNKDAAEAMAKKKLEEKPEELEKHLQLIDKCNDEVATHDNKCETGPKLMECIKTYAPGFGIVLPGPDSE